MGNYVWLTEKTSGLMKLKLFWRRTKTNWRRKLRPEGENIEIIQWKICISVVVYIGSFLCVKISTFLCCRRYFYGVSYVFTCQSPSSNLWRGSYISLLEKKVNQQYENISLCINQCWNAPNLINVQFLTNAYGNYVWLTE